MLLYFVRHGYPDYTTDTLIPLGKFQAEETSKYLKDIPFDIIFSSELGRAVETAECLASKQKKEIIKLNWAREDLAWQTFSALDEKTGHDSWIFFIDKYLKRLGELDDDPRWFDDPMFKGIDCEKGLIRMDNAVDKWLESLNIIHDRKTKSYYLKENEKAPDIIVLFAHGGMSLAFFSSILDIPYSYFASHFEHSRLCGQSLIDFNMNTHKAKLVYYNQINYDEKEFNK